MPLETSLAQQKKRSEELQSLLHNTVLEKEMLKSKLESQISVLQNKVDYAEKRIVQLNKEVDTLEELVESKHLQLAHQEKRSTSPKSEICKLQDENNNVQLSQQENPNDWQTHNTKQNKTSQKEQSTHKKNPNNIGKQERGSEENTRTNVLYNKAQVLLIGTSNIKYINSRFIAGSKAYVYKVQKFTIEEALKYIKDVTFENKPTCSPKVVIYHILCNDIEKYETAVLTKNMEELVANTKSKFPNLKIMISLRLPRRDPEFNLRVNTTNITLQNLFCSDPSVEICDNSNLFYRGYPQRGISSFKKRSSGTSQQFEG